MLTRIETNKFETPMELHCSQTERLCTVDRGCLRPLWNYTALKPVCGRWVEREGLRPLWNYTALKQVGRAAATFCGLRPLWNYTALKRSLRPFLRRSV